MLSLWTAFKVRCGVMRLSVQALAAERGSRRVFAGLNFAADAGTPVTHHGANGAGKTTLLRCSRASHAAAEGEYAWSVNGQTLRAAEAACFVGHANAFNDALSVHENLTRGRIGGRAR